MAKISVLQGATSVTVNIFIADSSSTTGAGLTGLVFNTSGLTCYYMRPKVAATAVTLATLAAVTTAYSSGGFKEIDATNAPGWYRFDIPDAAIANAERFVSFHFKGATNMAPLPLEVELTGWNNQDGVRGGLTALPNATAGASSGLHINGSNSGTTTYAALTVTGSLTISDGLLVSRSTSNASAITATGNGTGSGIVATSGAGATGDGLQAVAASTNGNGVTFTKTGSGKDLNATSTPLTLAKTTNITGFNDIAATAIVSSGAITTSGGAVSTVTTLTNAPSDSSGTTTLLGRLTSTRAGLLDNLDAAVTTRMASYTQPTGFLAATFPTTVASTTNITGGTITTVTNLTNAPTAGDFTAAMKTSLNAATPVVTLAAGAIDAASLSTAGKNAISDNLLDRDMSTGTDSGTEIIRTPRQALRVLRNKVDIPNGKVKKEDDLTDSWTFAVTTAAGNPVTVVDPT